MLLEGRKHLRSGERFLVQLSSVHDPLLTELASVENQSPSGVRLATERFWSARARVVYCQALGPKKFVVGLNILSREGDLPNPANPRV